jgi:hypothetical protein
MTRPTDRMATRTCLGSPIGVHLSCGSGEYSQFCVADADKYNRSLRLEVKPSRGRKLRHGSHTVNRGLNSYSAVKRHFMNSELGHSSNFEHGADVGGSWVVGRGGRGGFRTTPFFMTLLILFRVMPCLSNSALNIRSHRAQKQCKKWYSAQICSGHFELQVHTESCKTRWLICPLF